MQFEVLKVLSIRVYKGSYILIPGRVSVTIFIILSLINLSALIFSIMEIHTNLKMFDIMKRSNRMRKGQHKMSSSKIVLPHFAIDIVVNWKKNKNLIT